MPGKPAEFCIPVRVYIEDTDAGGIVYYVNYLKFMERARTEWLRSLGYVQSGLLENNIQFVVRATDVRYRQPAGIDDELAVTVGLEKVGRASLAFHQQVWRENELLCDGRIQVACVRADTLAPTALPSRVHQAIREGENT
jgi:4-hydroxybenzoyl-CoA thioesterase